MSGFRAAGSTSGRMVKQGYAFVRAFYGVVVEPDGHRSTCFHSHRSPSAARKCAIAAAARMNRNGKCKIRA